MRVRTEHHKRHRPEHVDVDGAGPGEAGARPRDRMHHQRRLGHPEPGTAECVRHRRPQPAARRHIRYERIRKRSVGIPLKPVVVSIDGTHLVHRIHDGLLIFGQLKHSLFHFGSA